MRKKLTVGILAHVDAGKTTLSEALLYLSGKLRTQGRVDHKNTYLDTNPMERERGITIFSKQARFSSGECDIILLDTPGHVDFSAEAERTLSLLDYAILVISAPDGIQSHTRTLWNLLQVYNVPTFVFVNKTDLSIKQAKEMEEELSRALSPSCVPFYENDTASQRGERLALVHEAFLEACIEGASVEDEDVAALISERRLFPCFFGSALRLDGISFLLEALDRYTLSPFYEEGDFGAQVYKISNAAGRLTFMKITSGTLSVRDEICYLASDGTAMREKIGVIRLYSGDKFEQVEHASAGEICAVLGLSATFAGLGLGIELNAKKPTLEPVLSYVLELPSGCDPLLYFPKLKQLEEEEPSLHLSWNEELRHIEARLMGDIQTEVLTRLIRERVGIDCTPTDGKILYKEKIASKAIGVGHFEPLRHYAEVQLLIEPAPKGAGLIFDARVDESSLDKNWQRLILSHLYEKAHRGTQIGALLTDTKVTLIAGRAHQKHTEGGDFREATHRALRQGLMRAGCVLLEPYYKFRLELPRAFVGRAMSDLQERQATFTIESATDLHHVLVGRAPVSTLGGYTRELISYTRGEGTLSCIFDGYEPCHNEEEIVSRASYDPTADMENTPHSVFCDHGAGFVVPWNEVDRYKHLSPEIDLSSASPSPLPQTRTLARKYKLSDEELEAIMKRTFGPIKRRQYRERRVNAASGEKKHVPKKALTPHRRLLIVDGYNIIYAHEELKKAAEYSLEKARELLMDMLSNYVAFTKTELVLVFDAYLVKKGAGTELSHDGYRIVYTKENQTADAYIERMMHELGPDYSIRVVTGDSLVQLSAVHAGVLRMTAHEFFEELEAVSCEISEFLSRLAEKKS